MISFSSPNQLCAFALLTILLLFGSCDAFKGYHQPDTPAKFKVVIKSDNCSADNLLESDQLLHQRLIDNGVYFQKSTVNADLGQITFDVIGYEEGSEQAMPVEQLLTQRINLKIVQAMQVSDEYPNTELREIVEINNLGSIIQLSQDIYSNSTMFTKNALAVVLQEDSLDYAMSVINKRSRRYEFLPGKESFYTEDGNQERIFIYGFFKKGRFIDETSIENAEVKINPTTGTPLIFVEFSAAGTKEWAEITTAAANNGRRAVLIIVNDYVVSAPSVNEPILGGSVYISGYSESTLKRDQFARTLNTGNTPCHFEVIEQSEY